MKTKLAQLTSFIAKFDRRHLQFAYFALVMVSFILLPSPYDGGGGPI